MAIEGRERVSAVGSSRDMAFWGVGWVVMLLRRLVRMRRECMIEVELV